MGPGTRISDVVVDFDVDLNFSFTERHNYGHGAPYILTRIRLAQDPRILLSKLQCV